MQKKTEEHIFQGMQRDMSISKQKPEYLWDAHNIRLTARHGDTLLSLTNEKGTKRIDNINLDGVVLGYCVLGNYLTVFTTKGSDALKPDNIYRIDKIGDKFVLNNLYNGNLNFNVNDPIECLGVYENEKIQKVYWTDGRNQPRFINITKNLINANYSSDSFDFIPTLDLNDTIHIKKVPDSSGLFPAGVIQYAVTYYNKYGQESNISVISPLIPTSYTSRAGSPEDIIGNAFKITIKNPDMQFEYLRLYSIFRSSKDTTPVCKRVADVKLGEGSGTSETTKSLSISDDKENIITARFDIGNVSIKLNADADYVSPNQTYHGNEDITLPWNSTLNAEWYYHFSKEEFPQLIIKTKLYDDEGNLNDKFITWGNCTDIYLSRTAIDGPGDDTKCIIVCGTGNQPAVGDMVSANYIDYETTTYKNNGIITITDNNTAGEDVDYNELLFIGGEEITAGTITLKDGTMFLGDIKISRPLIEGNYLTNPSDISIEQEINKQNPNIVGVIRKGTSIQCSHRTCYFPLTMNSSTYKWGNTLDAHIDSINGDSTNIAGFKWKDHYRLGLQFQYKTGKWSQPVFIKDRTMGIADDGTAQGQSPSLDIDDVNKCYILNVPSFIATLNPAVGQYMLDNGYKRVRAVVCFPTESDQLILCQGLLNPTVHSIAGRLNHTPDVLSSWFFRPIPAGDESSKLGYYEGGIPQYKHGFTLYSGVADTYINSSDFFHEYRTISPTRNDEILGVPVEFSNISAAGIIDILENNNGSIDIDVNNYSDLSELRYSIKDAMDLTNVFAVDWEYLTFHSPEFEFNDSFHNMDTSTVGCRITGKHIVHSNQGDIHILTSSAPIGTDAPGFYHRVIRSESSACRINTGLFYKDTAVSYTGGNDGKYEPFKKGHFTTVTDLESPDYGKEVWVDDDLVIHSFAVYPWHRTGSLNNDCVRADNKGTRTAMLSQKKLSNLMYFGASILQEGTTLSNFSMKMFNSDQIALTKINDMNYFGNVDQVLSSYVKYPIGATESEEFTAPIGYLDTPGWSKVNTYARGLRLSNDHVYMKYKSTPHAIIHTNEFLSGIENYTWSKEQDPVGHSTIITIDGVDTTIYQPYLYCAEMYRDPLATDFGGTSPMAIHNNLWHPAGPAVKIGYTVDGNETNDNSTQIPYWYGDTYYQRYDCLKTYPFTDEDTNSIIEIGSFMVETRINLDGRYDRNRGNISNFMLNPTNFNLINPVYSQMDNFFNYRILDEDYYALNNYPTMVTWTGYKNNAAEIDNWTNITLASTLEMDGTKGKVNAVRVNSDQLYCFQDDAIGLILFNSRVQISPSDGVPIEISNNYKVDGNRYISTSIGCKNKWSIAEGVDGLYFIDDNTKALYSLGGQAQIKPVSTPLNLSYWFMNQDTSSSWIQRYYDNYWEYKQYGIRCFYDNANADLYICTPEETLCYSEKLGLFVSFFDYHNVIGMFNIDSEYYALNYPEINSAEQGIKLWSMFKGLPNVFFDEVYQTDITFISNENPLNDKIFTNVELRGDFRYNGELDHRKMFDTLKVWNEYQDTGEVNLNFINDVPSNMKKKFRIWRMDIPRDNKHKRERIRNTWSKVKFVMNKVISLADICNKTSSDFMVWDGNTWVDIDFRDTDTRRFIYDVTSDRIVEKEVTPSYTREVAYYLLKGNIITKTTGIDTSTETTYAYRKLYDMEVHDIGVVYFV